MDHAEKGQRYARIFRKAGTFLGKGNIARAAEVLKEGIELARSLGDEAMARRFEEDLRRAEEQGGQTR
jgi:Tfp pilus assembly protein PilF